MWNEPTKKQLEAIPKLYATEEVKAADKIIFLHFFIGGCDWYVAEFDGEDTFFGYAILNSDTEMAEWGYVNLSELKSLKVHGIEIDRELNWTPKKASLIPKITHL